MLLLGIETNKGETMTFYIILDWTGKDVFDLQFTTFDNAEEELAEFLGNRYDTDRQEYDIVEI